MIPKNWELEFFILAIVGSFGGPYLGMVLFDKMAKKLRKWRELRNLERRRIRNEADN